MGYTYDELFAMNAKYLYIIRKFFPLLTILVREEAYSSCVQAFDSLKEAYKDILCGLPAGMQPDRRMELC